MRSCRSFSEELALVAVLHTPLAAERARVELPRIMPVREADVSEATNGAEHFPFFDCLNILQPLLEEARVNREFGQPLPHNAQ